MEHAQAEESVEDLLQGCERAGFAVTRNQLRRWQREGLLPRPRQRGLGRGEGTEVLYPPGTTGQLIALCELREKNNSFNAICWGLWWRGYPVSNERIRYLFERQLEFAERLADVLTAPPNPAPVDGERDIIDVLDAQARVRLPHPFLNQMRRRTGKERFPTFMNFLVRAFAGIPEEFVAGGDDAEIVAKGFGFIEPGQANELLPSTADDLDPRKLREAFQDSSAEDLAEARDEVRAFIKIFDAAISLEEFPPQTAAIIRSIAGFFVEPTHEDGTHIVLYWLSVRRSPSIRKSYDEFVFEFRVAAKGISSSIES